MKPTIKIADPSWPDIHDRDRRIAELEAEAKGGDIMAAKDAERIAELEAACEGHLSQALEQAKTIQKLEAEIERLRQIVDRIVLVYKAYPVRTAKALDEEIDRSGALLGWIRDTAMEGE